MTQSRRRNAGVAEATFDTGSSNDAPGTVDQIVRTVTEPLAVLSRALPAGPVPVALGASALAVAGVIEWPIAAAVGLGYLALRRWH